jgi:hypothetical protein
MTPEQVRQQLKNEALNKIRKLFRPEAKFSQHLWDGSKSEQQMERIESIIESLEKDLAALKEKANENPS